MLAALNLLEDLDGRRVAVLGDMLELGQAEEESHRLIGRRARQVARVLVTVGERGRIIAAEALRAGMPTAQVHITHTAAEAIALLRRLVTANDVILVKGSRAVHMDEIVAGLVRPEGETVDR
jgi:UDP-N-acetylmuramoyl-tripeptide--D-alanyl-D-alanine ligase